MHITNTNFFVIENITFILKKTFHVENHTIYKLNFNNTLLKTN